MTSKDEQKVGAWESLKLHHKAPLRLRVAAGTVLQRSPSSSHTVLNPKVTRTIRTPGRRCRRPAVCPLGRPAWPLDYQSLFLASRSWARASTPASRSPVVMGPMAACRKGRWPSPSCSHGPEGRATKQPNPVGKIQTSQPQPQGLGKA